MKIHKSCSHIFANYGYQKVIIRPQNNPEDILHILTSNKEHEVASININQIIFWRNLDL